MHHAIYEIPPFGLTVCSAKGVPSFLSYFKTLSLGPTPGVEPATFRSTVKGCNATDWANPAVVKDGKQDC